MLVPTRKWEADVELRPSENEDIELTPPTVVQEEDVVDLVELDADLPFDSLPQKKAGVELRHAGEVFSFDWLWLETVLLSHYSAEEGDELGLVVVDAVLSFDCQEIPDDLDSDTRQGPQHFTTSATRSDRKRVHVENSIFSRKLRSKE